MAGQEARQSPGTEPRFFYGYIVVVATAFIMVVVWGTYYAFGVFFKPMLTEFGWTRATTSGAFSLALIIHGLLGIAMGWLTDKFGPRLVMTLCGSLMGAGYLLMSQISAVWQLYLFYGVIVGTGMGGAFVPLVSPIARWFVKRRGVMTGIVVAGLSIGAVIAPPVANWLIYSYGWRQSYVILGTAVLVIVILAAQFLKRDPTQVGQAAYGEDRGERRNSKSEAPGFSLGAAVRTRQFWITLTILFFFGFSFFTIMVHIVPHAIELGISATAAANILAAVGMLSIFGTIALGSAGDRIGSRQAFSASLILLSAALFWLVPATDLWMLYLFAAVFGFAYGGGVTSQSPLVATLFGLRSHGFIYGVLAIGFTAGGAIGSFLAGYIFDISGSYQVALLLSASVSVISFTLAVVLRPIKRPW